MVDARIRPATLTWWGHSSVELRMDGVRLVADPLLRRHVGPLASSGHRPRDLDVDLVLLSHLHRDHTDLPSVRRFGRRTTVVAPPGGRDLVGRRARGPVTELMVGESLRVGDVAVVAVPALHDGRRHVGGVEGQAVGYLVVGTQVFYLAGDTDMYDGMADLSRTAGRSVDVAVLPVSGWGLNVSDPRSSAESARTKRSAPRGARTSCRSAAVASGSMGTRSAMATGPLSSPSSICMMLMPLSRSPAMIARWIGAAPRQRGSSEACTLNAPSGNASKMDFGRINP